MSDQNMSSSGSSMDIKDTDADSCHDMPTHSNASSSDRFIVTKWEAMAQWSWDVIVDNCGICRNQIMELCIECQANPMGRTPKEECTVAWGTCNHAFHLHCISRWLKACKVCPLDNKPWEYLKYGR